MKYENNYGVYTQEELKHNETPYKLNSSPTIQSDGSIGPRKIGASPINDNELPHPSEQGYIGDNKVFTNKVEEKNKIFTSFDDMKDNDEILRTLWSNGIYRKNDYDDFNKFYIFPRRDPYKMLGTTREYIFITKPDLHIFGSKNVNWFDKLTINEEDRASMKSTEDPSKLNPELQYILFFSDMFNRGYKEVLESLTYSHKKDEPFVRLLSNYKLGNLELSNVTVGDEETAANIYNTRIFYRKPSDSADEESDVTIEFKDNKYLDCYMWFKAYDMYERLKYQGKVTPVDWNYTMYKVLSDQMSIFRFVVGDDGETIIHWAQMFGCYPKSVPRANLSDMPEDGQLRFTVDWKVTFQSDLDPMTIAHFDALCDLYRNGKRLQRINLYDTVSQRITGEAASIPYVIKDNDPLAPRQQYKLVWFKAV